MQTICISNFIAINWPQKLIQGKKKVGFGLATLGMKRPKSENLKNLITPKEPQKRGRKRPN
jgi:hypothetical protein